MRIGVIDVGTNTTLLLIAELLPGPRVKPLAQRTATPKLGHLIARSGTIQEENLYKTIEIIKGFCAVADAYNAVRVVMAGTAPFRSAQNAGKARQAIERSSGLDLEVLTEREEALWTYRGACWNRSLAGSITAADIGGGSTEIVFGDGRSVQETVSMPVGAVTAAEKNRLDESPDLSQRLHIRRCIAERIPARMISRLRGSDHLIAIGGTATTLAWLASGKGIYDHDAVDGMRLTRLDIDGLVDMLSASSTAGRRQRLHLDPERAEIIIPGSLILQALLDCGGRDSALISDRGLRFGLALREATQH